jgi:hypothetical protein
VSAQSECYPLRVFEQRQHEAVLHGESLSHDPHTLGHEPLPTKALESRLQGGTCSEDEAPKAHSSYALSMFGPWSAGAAHTRVAFEVSTALESWRNYPSFDYGPAEYPYTGARLEGRMVGRFQEHEKSHKHLHARGNHGTKVSQLMSVLLCALRKSVH